MTIKSIVVGAFETNCYIVWKNPNNAMVIDPGGESERILTEIIKLKVSVTKYVLTHGHVDHINAVSKLSAHMPAPVLIHPTDAEWAFSEVNSFEPYYFAPEKPSLMQFYPDNGVLEDTDVKCIVIHTPGHTQGSVCLYFPDNHILFSGDTLFAGSVGRTDLPGGDTLMLHTSLKKLIQLPENTIVYPGHGLETNIAFEKQNNPFLS